MLSKEEKRFVRYWQDQRADGKGKYFLMYVLAGTFIVSIFIFIVLFFGFHIPVSEFLFVVVPLIGMTISVVITYIGWTTNESKFKKLIRREIKAGQEMPSQFDEDTIAP